MQTIFTIVIKNIGGVNSSPLFFFYFCVPDCFFFQLYIISIERQYNG
nr:MAG TPA: hypothetical protein [Caudoviricetes sp.]